MTNIFSNNLDALEQARIAAENAIASQNAIAAENAARSQEKSEPVEQYEIKVSYGEIYIAKLDHKENIIYFLWDSAYYAASLDPARKIIQGDQIVIDRCQHLGFIKATDSELIFHEPVINCVFSDTKKIAGAELMRKEVAKMKYHFETTVSIGKVDYAQLSQQIPDLMPETQYYRWTAKNNDRANSLNKSKRQTKADLLFGPIA